MLVKLAIVGKKEKKWTLEFSVFTEKCSSAKTVYSYNLGS
jgi:hypothetical protein